ncbi:EFR1 family ferrodoxin [Maribellus sp. YY47]|uniref:EFR1 family ferrodoxin n=1 Tax=Maribellus sp. YY47 TaxID=2929486 RepID=UPI0020013B50|nr:EFR1 family ferrodoxin [Maribellus sp. YY47]MCK3686430.1 EFR1 family ferrodoxin [Maribellus sp. YY47]
METLSLIYYSPTKTTQKIVREIGQNMGLKLISENNIAENKIESMPKAANNCLTIIGMPVYAGRLPITAIDRLKKIQSNQSPVVIVVVYGNRDYDDSLLELNEIASNCGFKVIAGAAFIGEHSYSTNEKPIAKNRPDQQDLEKCRDFARMITEKLKDINSRSELNIPGNYPYKERKQLPATIHPETDNDRCNQCGICVDSCPANAITIQETVITNGELCTLCCACVKYCPDEARTLDTPIVNTIRENLFLNCSIRKEPEYFI